MFGGSWGSTLALAYAQAHPSRVAGCVLRGVFLGRDAEVEWFLYGLRRFFPDAWQAFAEHDVSLRTVRQEGRGDDAQLVVVSHRATDEALAATVKQLRTMADVRDVTSVMRVEGA